MDIVKIENLITQLDKELVLPNDANEMLVEKYQLFKASLNSIKKSFKNYKLFLNMTFLTNKDVILSIEGISFENVLDIKQGSKEISNQIYINDKVGWDTEKRIVSTLVIDVKESYYIKMKIIDIYDYLKINFSSFEVLEVNQSVDSFSINTPDFKKL